MKKDSFVFYISQYEAIKELEDEQLGKLFRAIFEKQLGKEVVLENSIKIAFNFIINQMVVDKQKYLKKCETLKNNAKKGGAPKGNQNAKKEKQPNQPNREKNNLNDNENDNDNVNEYDNDLLLTTTTNIYSYIEDNFNRVLSPIEVESIDKWLLLFNEDIIKHAIRIAVFNNKKTFKYVDGILKNWKSCNYTTLQEIKDEETKRKDKKGEKVELFDYDWLNDGENYENER